MMNAINSRNILLRSGILLSLLFGEMMILAAPTRAQVAGNTYEVTLQDANNPNNQEKDCFKFDATNTLTVVVPGGTEIPFTFASRKPDKTDKQEFRWQAVSRTPFNFGMSGLEKVVGVLQPVSNLSDGNIVSAGAATFTFTGKANPNCKPPQALTAGPSSILLDLSP